MLPKSRAARRTGRRPVEEYAALLRSQIYKADMLLFPIAERVLSTSELESVAKQFGKLELEKMGPGPHERLHAKMATFLNEVYAVK